MSAPTPGQWTAIWSESFARWVIYDSVSRVVAQVVPDDYRETDKTAPTHQKTNQANARLIAAAPQLQDALRELVKLDSMGMAADVDQWDQVIAQAIAALNASRTAPSPPTTAEPPPQ